MNTRCILLAGLRATAVYPVLRVVMLWAQNAVEDVGISSQAFGIHLVCVCVCGINVVLLEYKVTHHHHPLN